MIKSPPSSCLLRNLLACAIALLIPACACRSDASPRGNVNQLQTAHLGFIDGHTAAAAPSQWNEAAFNNEVTAITTQFTKAASCVPKAVPARREFITNSTELFQRDVAKVRKSHFLSPIYAAFKRKQIQQNYSLIIKP